MEIFSKRFKELRIESGLSISKIAKEIGVSVSTISRIEKCQGIIRLRILVKIAMYFNICIDFFLGMTNERKKLK